MELQLLTLGEAASQIQKKELSPRELTQACAERIQALDPLLNCFITRTVDAALEQARRAETEIQRGGYLGPLHGIPLAVKDLFETAGVRTTAGSRFFADYFPQEDALVIQKLRSAGAVFLGKLNMHEVALGLTTVNPHYGPCHNPWSLERISGGSSGGSAAAVAAGLCLGSLGSDTGGSIRVPASLCGVVGLKPTFGRVSLRGVIPLSWNLDHVGPLARSVRDAAILLQAIAGYDDQDPASVDAPVPDYLAGLQDGVRGWTIGLASDAFYTESDPQVWQAIQAAADVFRHLGAQVIPVELPEAYQAAQANGLMVQSDAAAFHQERLATRPEDFGADVLKRLQTGAALSSTEYILARRTQSIFRRRCERLFESIDLLVTPATAVTAPLIEGPDAIEQARRLTRYTAPFNLAGLPAISLPAGFSGQASSVAEGLPAEDVLPIGMQLVAPAWAEARLLRGAYAYEQATGWHQQVPQFTVI
jgi:aspartyl-tRNA(Asn)/glutamyl-tRNA(Gln) amidotransferase subunit A